MYWGFRVRRVVVTLNGKIAVVAIGSMLLCTGASAQQPGNGVTETSELTLMNLSRVAASAAQIRAVLTGSPGLLVDLKRWVARDAASHGQILGDADLTDNAIFDRLEADVQFRSVATSLLQKYGYLVPDVNPGSDLAKEHDLLLQERTKLMAQRQERQEQELTATRKSAAPGPNSPNGASCGSALSEDCKPAEGLSTSGAGGLKVSPETAPAITAPAEPETPYAPSDRKPQPTQIAQSTEDAAGVFFPFSADDRTAGDELARIDGASSPIAQPRPALLDGILQDPLSAEALTTEVETSSEPAPPKAGTQVAEPTRRKPMPPPARPPEMVRTANPYRDVPSLYDMYVQATPYPENPKRFGAEIFSNGTRDVQATPMDLPAGPDYVVGPGDGLSIDVWGSVTQRLSQTVDREGRVSLPEVGPILVSGKSLAEVQQNMQQVLRSQFRDVSADVSLARLRTIRVYEVGDIANPGAYDISSLSTPLNALFVAGGPTSSGSMRILKHYRGNQLIQTVDVYDLLLHGVKANLERLENGDTILVPTIGSQVTVEGLVRRPAVYELRDEKTLADVLELAGGLLPVATLRHIEVERIVNHDRQEMVSLDVQGENADAEVTKKIASFEIRDGDRVRVYPIAPYSQNSVFLSGHVTRPGKYSYRDGMRVTDLISTYQDLLPEPAREHAEIIRLNPPDYRPSVETFNLAEALDNPAQAPILRPLDTVRIFSRFDFEDVPTVSVGGEVRMPGTYQTSGQLRLVDAIHLAGGLSPDAETGDAQVFRYLPDGTLRIFSVALSRALTGETAENIVLQPRDQLLIHRSPNQVDPAAVYLQGEVARPGHYPLSANMRVADLIRVGGGLLAGADTQTADLTKYEWSGQSALEGKAVAVALSAALKGNADANLPLRNGDVLTVRQIPGWSDLGASITLKGEVKHPGTYGIRPGERLSSILQRAGGFQPDAYPYGAILQRQEVRDLESRAQVEMVLRVKDSQSALELLPDKDAAQKQAKDASLQQWQATLDQLAANPPIGRVALHIGPDSKLWQNTAADVEVRAGDTLTIPKKAGFVMVTGQVFNATAIAYRPGKSASWYLGQSGGPTPLANRKAIFVVRADGSVVGSKKELWAGDPLKAPLKPGDTVVVPEKPFGGPVQWQTVFAAAQVASAVASTVFIALRY